MFREETKKVNQSIIATITDFGLRGRYYLAQMIGVAKSIHPTIEIIEITNYIHPFSILEAAYVLYSTYNTFPKGTVFVCAVYPDGGTDQDIIGVEIKGDYILIGPDNGCFTHFHEHNLIEYVVKIEDPDFFYQPFAENFNQQKSADVVDDDGFKEVNEEMDTMFGQSTDVPLLNSSMIPSIDSSLNLSSFENKKKYTSTFNGRDIMMPAAAHILNGLDLFSLGEMKEQITLFSNLSFDFERNATYSEYSDVIIQSIDEFGNLITNIPNNHFTLNYHTFSLDSSLKTLLIILGEEEFEGFFTENYAKHSSEQLLVNLGSGGFLELSYNQNTAAKKLKLKIENSLKIKIGNVFEVVK